MLASSLASEYYKEATFAMPAIMHQPPPLVGQRLSDSCWAAVLESWSRATPTPFATQQQEALIQRHGEGRTGGITPLQKVPLLAGQLGLAWKVERGAQINHYINQHLRSGLIFCAYPIGNYCHAVLIYGADTTGRIAIMDPNHGGRHTSHADTWFARRGNLILMRKAR
jgi:hypothetical protein